MEKLSITRAQLKATRDRCDRDYNTLIAKFDDKERGLKKRLNELNKKRFNPDRANLDASDDDLLEINVGGKIIAAKRSTLTQLKGTRFEALFSGRWEKELQRDFHGQIFIDVNPVGFRAIVDYLNELAISSEENPPNPPSVCDDQKVILYRQLQLFGLYDAVVPNLDSMIIKDESHLAQLHSWLEEDGSDGDFHLLYRSSRDGLSSASFHSKCDGQGRTLTIIKSANDLVLGGYSNTPWKSDGDYCTANKAFLFVLSGNDTSCPLKIKLKDSCKDKAVKHSSSQGPTFGTGHDLNVNGSNLNLYIGSSYESVSGKLARIDSHGYKVFTIEEMELFQVSGEYYPAKTIVSQAHGESPAFEPVTRFSEDVNQDINARQESLFQAEAEILYLEERFEDEKIFIPAFATGKTKDVVMLNVSGTIMAAKRSTLQAVEDSVLTQQFDDAKWTEQGHHASCVRSWSPSDVASWASNIFGIQEDVSNIFKQHNINGRELVALNMEGLKMLGVNRPGTLCLLLDEILTLRKAIAALIEHSPYCFGKILDYLRRKQLQSQGLLEKSALPPVCDTQKDRFEKVLQYYFPGDSAKLLLS